MPRACRPIAARPRHGDHSNDINPKEAPTLDVTIHQAQGGKKEVRFRTRKGGMLRAETRGQRFAKLEHAGASRGRIGGRDTLFVVLELATRDSHNALYIYDLYTEERTASRGEILKSILYRLHYVSPSIFSFFFSHTYLLISCQRDFLFACWRKKSRAMADQYGRYDLFTTPH